MEHGVHVFRFIKGIKYGACDITHALGDEPDDSRRRHRVHQRLEGHKDAQTHTHETERLHVRVLLQADETDDGADDGTGPHEYEQRPAPIKRKVNSEK